jgi:DNA-binding IclR family transcriptional regulator
VKPYAEQIMAAVRNAPEGLTVEALARLLNVPAAVLRGILWRMTNVHKEGHLGPKVLECDRQGRYKEVKR